MFASSRVAQVQSFKHVTEIDNRRDLSSRTSHLSEGIRLTKQVLAARDFWAVTLTNFFHTCRNVAHMNFASIITEALIPRDILPLGSWQLSAFYGLLTVVPQIVMIASTRQIVKHGCYRLFMLSLYISIITGLFAYMFASTHPYLVMAFMLIDSIAVHSLSPLMNILFADFIDDDMVRHNRPAPLSSLIFSLNALIVKPAQSLSPMAIVYILNQNGYLDYQAVKVQGYDGKTFDPLRDCMFTILCAMPVLLGVLELVVFRRYSLKDRHLSNLNSDMNKLVVAM
uniref:Uncharacterized protein n=1 Tax=Plectus sambesii TaxID=2011161 RepID=A0A914UI37_9BILA